MKANYGKKKCGKTPRPAATTIPSNVKQQNLKMNANPKKNQMRVTKRGRT